MSHSHHARGRSIRAWIAGCAAVWMVAGPALHLTTGLVCPGSPPWRMFEHDSLGVTDVKFTGIDGDGRELPVDRYAAFGATGLLDAPAEVRVIQDLESAERIARAICSAEPEAEGVRITVRVAHEEGWGREAPTLVSCRAIVSKQEP